MMDPSSTHFVFIPLMAPGHLLPMVDLARSFARRNVKVTILTTPLNAIRIRASITRDNTQLSASPIHLHVFPFPNTQAGLPHGCESLDTVPSVDHQVNFVNAISMLQNPLEHSLQTLQPTPICIISDRNIPCVADVAKKFGLPRILFDGTNCFTLLCNHILRHSRIYQNCSDSDPFVVPGLPDRIEFTRSQLPGSFSSNYTHPEIKKFREKVRESEGEAYGVVVNSFQELEGEYVEEYKKVTGQKVWCVGPVCLANKDNIDKAHRGNNKVITSKDEDEECEYYLKWLDKWPQKSVIYVCLGTLNRVTPEQQMEIGLGVESTKRPFIWVVREKYKAEEMEKLMLEDGLEERVRERGLVIRGWVPQVLILSHVAIGGFLTHCGWNSTVEGMCNGVPLVTFPLFSDQFYNEKVIVEVKRIGVRVGAQVAVVFGEEDKFGVQVRKEDVKEAIEKVMGDHEESEGIRERVHELKEMAKLVIHNEGSSYLNMSLLIQDVITHHSTPNAS